MILYQKNINPRLVFQNVIKVAQKYSILLIIAKFLQISRKEFGHEKHEKYC